jgi:hypothetical protein
MYSKTKINLLLVVPILVLLVTVMSPLMESRSNLLQNSFAQIMPATLPTGYCFVTTIYKLNSLFVKDAVKGAVALIGTMILYMLIRPVRLMA